MPIQMFNWVSRPDQAFQANAAAAGAVLLGMTLLMNTVAIRDPLSASARESTGERHGKRSSNPHTAVSSLQR